MRTSLVLALTAGLGGAAFAQPGPPPAPPPPPADSTGTTTTTTTVEATPTPAPTPAPKPTPVAEQPATDTHRPDSLSIALGAGYGLPTSLEMPNVTSARLRFAGGLTLEPRLQFSNETAKQTPPMGSSTEDKETVFEIEALGRLPVIVHNRVDLEILAGAGFSTDKLNPDGDFNTKTTTTIGLVWGLGIGYWISRHWQFSMSVTNPLIAFSTTKTQTGPGITVKSSDTAIGLVFDPGVVMMVHLYN